MTESHRVTITPNDNGPYRVVGSISVSDAEGNVLREAEEVYLCRCGNSDNKPFCDGTHKATGFESQVRAE